MIDSKKFRIKESFNNMGDSLFSLQKRTFWGWRDFSVRHIEKSRTFSGSYDKFLDKIVYQFGKKQDCINFYSKVLEWKDIQYKGRKIMKTWESHDVNNCRYVLIMTNPYTYQQSLLIERKLDEVIKRIDYWERGNNMKKPKFHNLKND